MFYQTTDPLISIVVFYLDTRGRSNVDDKGKVCLVLIFALCVLSTLLYYYRMSKFIFLVYRFLDNKKVRVKKIVR